jgi:hypothetical protein
VPALPELPDEPRWVDAHGIAGEPDSWRRLYAGGIAVGSDRARLVVASPEVPASDLGTLAAALPAHAIVVAGEHQAAALRGPRAVARAIVHTLPDPDALPDLEGAIPLPPDASVAHLPAPLVAELAGATGPVWTVYVDGAPSSFAYAAWRSARWFDVSVDTVPGARQLGLGTIVGSTLVRDERAAGREPVWTADEDNHASRALAHRLGFVAVDELWIALPISDA